MPIRAKNTFMWAVMGSLPVSRLLRLPTSQSIRQQFLLFIALGSEFIYHIALLLRYSSIFLPAQLVELFVSHLAQANRYCTTYSFFLPRPAFSFFFITLSSAEFRIDPVTSSTRSHSSIDFFFDAAWWLERECTEMVGSVFSNKGDDRNLLLEYANVYRPLVRVFPSFGIFEVIYNSFLRLLELRRTSLQQA
uniref:NADH dehydrogenase subunit 9 n=1 Tax=Moneuplotes minuta TaxID=74792 RepID=D1LDN9_9SPIT|nr:NADH dehydrogenase subunit 9 [Moneuplotes minuta]